ncbi:MAG: SDR family NAD(P)-dependent oxidoreductase [Rhodospirillaceae bacterium]|nr:SDR family NAD(P)-dependent oxidoreductase [Rhodospirillaceae bacterium]
MSGDGGKSALVTGAAGGLGLAIAQRLAADGCRVALADIDGEGAARSAAELHRASGYSCDVTCEDSVGEMLGRFEAAFGGPPDILVNNAGIVRFGDLLEHPVEDFRKVTEVNLVGTFLMIREVGARMAVRGSGAIVNITSLNAVQTSPDAGAYPATKAAVAKLTEQFALALGPRGVRVNAVAPGFIDAGMSAPIYRDPEVRAERGRAVPAGRIGTAADVAAAVAFLASDEAGYVQGQHLLVDGGVSFSLKNQMPRKAPKEAEK